MKKLLDELKELVEDNYKLEMQYTINYVSNSKYWSIDVCSPYSDKWVYCGYGYDLKEVLQECIKEVKKFVDNFKWEE
jgi:hypothetical protein